MLTFVYLPYAHYQEKIKAKQIIREVSQWINEARNMAINGFDQTRADWSAWSNLDEWINKSIWLYFSREDDKKGEMYFYAYPFTFSGSLASLEELSEDDYQINKWRVFPKWTQFDGAMWDQDKDGIFFFFEAITGKWEYYVYSWWVRTIESSSTLTLDFSYKWAESDVLKKSLTYDTRINTIDF